MNGEGLPETVEDLYGPQVEVTPRTGRARAVRRPTERNANLLEAEAKFGPEVREKNWPLVAAIIDEVAGRPVVIDADPG